MFEVPAVYPYDHEIYSSEAKLFAFYRALEQNDIKHRTETYVEPRDQGFVGLVTHGLYDSDGNLLSDMFASFQERNGPRTQARNLLRYDKSSQTFMRNEQPDQDLVDNTSPASSEDEQIDDMYTSMLHQIPMSSRQFGSAAIALHNQSLTLPRTTVRPQITMDSLATQRIVEESLNSADRVVNLDFPLSESAQRVLMRSNYRVPYNIAYNQHDDEWIKLHMRRRSLHVVTTLLYLGLERRDYPRAWTALTCVLRGHWVDIRLVWMPAIELLAWRNSVYHQNTKSGEDLLAWLVATNPKLPKSRHNVHRYIPKATDLLPASILLKLVSNKFVAAQEEADQAVKSMQYATNPFCWALAGLSRLLAEKVGENHSENLSYAEAHKIQQSFVKCLELNGVLPTRLRKLAAKLSRSNSEMVDRLRENLESDSESDIESDNSEHSSPESENDQNSDSESEPIQAKRPKLETNSQVFYSQSALGAELGSSDSDEY